MTFFSDYELYVLNWLSRHRIPSSAASHQIPLKYRKTVLFLIADKMVLDDGPYYELSQIAKDALRYKKELSHVQRKRDFLLGFIAGVLSSLFVTVLIQAITMAIQ